MSKRHIFRLISVFKLEGSSATYLELERAFADGAPGE